MRRAVATARPDAIVNCAAYNDVDGAERDATGALVGNAFGVLHLARAARDAGAMFDALQHRLRVRRRGRPARTSKSDSAGPAGHLRPVEAAGRMVRRGGARAPTCCASRACSAARAAKSSIDRILATIQAGQPTAVFGDRTVSPSYVEDVVAATEALLERASAARAVSLREQRRRRPGWGSPTEVARLLGADAEHRVGEPRRREADVARRPLYCALSNQKLRDAGLVMPTWQDALRRHVASVAGRES